MRRPRSPTGCRGDVDDPDAPGNEWRTADTWPVPSREVAFRLQPDGGLARASAPRRAKPSTFEHDPESPVPTIGGPNLEAPAGPRDQRPIESRDDVVVFTSEPLERPLEVTGRLAARLHVQASGPRVDLHVRLGDVYPDGRSILITDGALALGGEASDEKPLRKREVREVTVDLWSTSIVLAAGHRLRVSVSGSNAPRFAVNEAAVAVRIFHDARRPSAVLLPVAGESSPATTNNERRGSKR